LADKWDKAFEAVYNIASHILTTQKCDSTKECKIVEAYTDAKGNKTGVYKVKSQDAVYDAYAK
jgi:hypothetical protein